MAIDNSPHNLDVTRDLAQNPVSAQPDQPVAEDASEGFNVQSADDLVQLIHSPDWKTILLDLVRKEKMDVWAIDLATLAGKYLKKIEELKETNLRIPANAILASAILLHLKSKTIRFPWLEKKEAPLTEEEKMAVLESLPELTTAFKVREGTVTLNELVDSIDEIMQGMKTKSPKNRNQAKIKPEFLVNISQESWDEKVDVVYSLIKQRVDSEGLTLFSNILESKEVMEKINKFVPLLFLMNRGKIKLLQETFFEEIFIQLLNQPIHPVGEGMAEE